MVRKNNETNMRLIIVIGILAIAIITGTILGSKYMEKFSNENTLIYFYMNNCPFCNDFEKEWIKIEKIVKSESKYSNLKLKKINLQSEEGSKYNEIQGAPTLMLLPSRKIYTGNREAYLVLEWTTKL